MFRISFFFKVSYWLWWHRFFFKQLLSHDSQQMRFALTRSLLQMSRLDRLSCVFHGWWFATPQRISDQLCNFKNVQIEILLQHWLIFLISFQMLLHEHIVEKEDRISFYLNFIYKNIFLKNIITQINIKFKSKFYSLDLIIIIKTKIKKTIQLYVALWEP